MDRWNYQIWVTPEPNDDDKRQAPSDSQVRACILAMPQAIKIAANALMLGVRISTRLEADEIVRFHHLRRAHGCCPRIKWHVICDSQAGLNMEGEPET